MKVTYRWAVFLLVMFSAAAALGGGCGSGDNGSHFTNGGGKDSGTLTGDDDSDSGPTLFGDGGFLTNGDGGPKADPSQLAITPATATLNVTAGTTPVPTQTFSVTYKGTAVTCSFVVPDNGALGTVSSPGGVFTPSQKLGGTATVTASYDGATISAKVTVVLSATQNGDPNPAVAGGDAGAGGYGGVGGDGPGGAVASTATLDGTPTPDTSLTWLYPYDQTVFPQGILAPLLMWNVGSAGDYDSIKISLGETNYKYTGYFSKSAAATGKFQNAPIPAAAWTALYSSNLGNEAVAVNVTLAKGTKAYALPARSWKIAGGLLQGTVYYQAYNTQLVKNSDFLVGPSNAQFQVGAATLAIQRDSTGPTLIAGTNGSTQGEGCRVCHVVSSDGSTLLTQRTKWDTTLSPPSDYPNYFQGEKYNLKNVGAGETTEGGDNGIFAWAALSPDGSLAVVNSGGSLPGAVDMSQGTSGSAHQSVLYNVGTAAPVTSTGLPTDLQASTPSFSPDGKHVAFNYWAGGGKGDQKSLGIADFDGTSTFTNLGIAYTPQTGQVVWPSFLPTSAAVVFATQLTGAYSQTSWNDFYGTPVSAKPTSALWWYDRASNTYAELKALNGDGYLPDGPNHTGTNDAVLNFEPTVDPIPSGGYAWVVFTSRRMYGNVATLDPYASDPRYDTGVNSLTQPTPKKLWIAAVDLNGTGGTDPSHPAFYLPAQELLGGNSRGYWANDACQADGTSCETGNQCCGGFCTSSGDAGALVCGTTSSGCAAQYDRCTLDTDCCDSASGIQCINHLCSVSSPR
jgi:hypothetical protein